MKNVIRLEDYREPPPDPVIVQVGEYGPLFELHPPHTAESLRGDAVRAKEHKPFLCWVKHKRRRVGDVHIPQGDTASLLARLASVDVRSLTRCARCGSVAIKRITGF